MYRWPFDHVDETGMLGLGLALLFLCVIWSIYLVCLWVYYWYHPKSQKLDRDKYGHTKEEREENWG